MNRRDFSVLLPMLMAVPTLASRGDAQVAPVSEHLQKLASGQYPPDPPKAAPTAPRISRNYLRGLLPENLRLEAHETHLAPGAPPEPIGHHKHSEIWLMREGQATLTAAGVTHILKPGDLGLCIAGDDHTITNASQTEPASYFVVTVGLPE